MNANMLKARFDRIGARLHVAEQTGREWPTRNRPLTLDVRSDGPGERFEVMVRASAVFDLDVIDLRRREQHLLLRMRDERGTHLYLCGRDEQHWFAAAIPESARVTNVFQAMEALKPEEVLEAQRRQGLKGAALLRRKNAAYVRQGEWFFLPAPRIHVDKKEVLGNEPLSRGNGSKPHWVEFLYRKGGETVYVSSQHPSGISTGAYLALIKEQPRAKSWNWRRMARDPEAYAKGSISHPDHKAVCLQVWHKVLMNTENQSAAMRHLAFLD